MASVASDSDVEFEYDDVLDMYRNISQIQKFARRKIFCIGKPLEFTKLAVLFANSYDFDKYLFYHAYILPFVSKLVSSLSSTRPATAPVAAAVSEELENEIARVVANERERLKVTVDDLQRINRMFRPPTSVDIGEISKEEFVDFLSLTMLHTQNQENIFEQLEGGKQRYNAILRHQEVLYRIFPDAVEDALANWSKQLSKDED